MSPEQAAGRLDQLSPASDIYGLGAILYCLLTGRPPFAGKNMGELLRRVEKGDWVAPRQVLDRVPRGLDAICRKAMALQPEARYPSAKALAEDVEHWLADEPVSAEREPLLARMGRWARRHRLLVAGSSALLLSVLVLGGGGLTWWHLRQAMSEQATRADLALAEEMLEKGQSEKGALQVIRRAEGRLAGGGAAQLRERARQLNDWVSFADKLEFARQQDTAMKNGGLDYEGSHGAYADLFARYSLDVASLPPEEAARSICSSPIRARLVMALDDWASNEDRHRPDGGESLRAVARLADDDEWRQKFRDSAVRKDRAKLESLAERADTLQQPSANIALLARQLLAANATATAERLLRQAQQRDPDDFWINYDLAYVLSQQPDTKEEAIGFFRAALALHPNSIAALNSLGVLLRTQGKLVEAEKVFRKALGMKPDFALIRNNLGVVMRAQKRLDEAEVEFRTALRIKPEYAEAHCNLGLALQEQGRFAEALASLERGHELGIKSLEWSHPSAQWIRDAKALVDLDTRLTKILHGDRPLTSASERIQFASFCRQSKQYLAALRFYSKAFIQQPTLAEEIGSHRYNAAGAAARAGCGQGKDAGPLDEKERGRLRQQALAWLRADLAAWSQRLDKEPERSRADVLAQMKHWQQDNDFACVRGDAVEKLPESERTAWRDLWDDVERLCGRAAEQK
jgi:Tfp pilus assembly protein PilF